MDIDDKICVITGGASGIGLGLAKALIGRGGHVVLADINVTRAHDAAADLGPRASAAALDVRYLESFETLADHVFATFGRVDVMINNAGVSGGRGVLDTPEEEIDWVIDVNLKGVWRGTSVFGKRMRDQTTPSIICNVASENALGYINQGLGIYAGSKHGVLGMCDVLRHELPPHMRVCVACPGLVNSDLTRSSAQTAPNPRISDKYLAVADRMFALGMAPEEAGEMIAKGIEREDFIIPVHPHVVNIAATRWQEIADSFATHAPMQVDFDKYDVMKLLSRLALEDG
ncbi:MAG: SDR family oxidoreductase [PS1 clade bacterium]|nr:SDR family oxidoreductase [PS1 clade bacterium]